MDPLLIKVKKVRPDAILPSRAKPGDLGIDFYCYADVHLTATKGLAQGVYWCPTGVALELPPGYGMLLRERSSAAGQGVRVLGGVMDPNYRGEYVCLLELLDPPQDWFRAVQGILVPHYAVQIAEVPILSGSERGADGFGSTGR